MRFKLLIITLVCAAMNVTAQTLSTDTLSVDSTAVHLYPDTFRLAEQPTTASIDGVLLDIVAKQSAELYADDTTYILTPEEQYRLDSIQREMAETDSLRALNANLVVKRVETIPTIEIEKSWIKDEEEDRDAVLRAIRNIHTRWRKEATVMVQVTQNYVTPNWYQGGSSSFACLGIVKGQIGYFTERFTWENTGEWRAGCSTISADSLHKINTTDDLFRIYSKANLRIVPKLYTSAAVELETRLLPTYKSNSHNLKSGTFAPLRFNFAIGLDYKPVKGLSISFSPLSYKMVHIMDTARVNVTEYGLKHGEQTQHNIGSLLRLEYTWNPVREFSMETKFYCYTNYHDVELDLEVNCDFIINRWLSARLTLHPRYDTSVIMDGDEHAKIQFRELLSIGFAHKFR
ncbi:MAG: DUF3078 domain-containing protein [Paludibacteraceae bacterium]|nr:DUF3078 domain-containing protein [Paludibacteraceae bacterium]